MSLAGQRLQPERYAIVPRTLVFLKRQDHILLLRLGEDRGAWSGLLNGIGGHIEQGEDPLHSARREILEETGLTPTDLRLSGVIIIDTGTRPGIGLYVFVGEVGDVSPVGNSEGIPEWVPLDSLNEHALVEDLPLLLPKALSCYEAGTTFSGSYVYDSGGALQMRFSG